MIPLNPIDLVGLELLARPVDLRRDLAQLVSYVQERGLKRSVRDNVIPAADARRLAKLLSFAGESAWVDRENCGYWSDFISRLGLQLQLLSFSVPLNSYTTTPDNHVTIQGPAWERWLAETPLAKETAILEALLVLVPPELYNKGTLLHREPFSRWGEGPATRMDVKRVRMGLLQQLRASTRANTWYRVEDFISYVQAHAPNLILDPGLRQPEKDYALRLRQWEWESNRGRKVGASPRPEPTMEDLYSGLAEVVGDPWRGERRKLSATDPDGFRRVEGRYIEWFLCELPYLHGLVELALRPTETPEPLTPALGRVIAFRPTDRLFQLVNQQRSLNQIDVTVLPTFEVLVSAPSYPESTLLSLEPFTTLLQEEGPVHRLKLDRRKIAQAAAAGRQPLAELSALCPQLPDNIRVEMLSWAGKGEQLTVFSGMGLVEIRDPAQQGALRALLGELVVTDQIPNFLLVRDRNLAFSRLEADGRVPERVVHEADFKASDGPLHTTTRVPTVPLSPVELRGYRCESPEILEALAVLLADAGAAVVGDLLVLPLSAEPKLKGAIKKLTDRAIIEIA